MIITLDGATGSQAVNSGVNSTNSTFKTTYLTGNPARSGYLSSGEMIEVEFIASFEMKEADSFVYGLASQNGVAKSLTIKVPDTLVNKREILFP